MEVYIQTKFKKKKIICVKNYLLIARVVRSEWNRDLGSEWSNRMQYKVEKEGGRETFSRETNKNQEYGVFNFVNKGTECVCGQKICGL